MGYFALRQYPFALSPALCLAAAFPHCVAASVTHLVSVEMIEGLVSMFRMRTNVAVTRVEAVINVTVEVVSSVEPRASSDENTASEPLGPIVSVRGTIVWSEVVVAVGAHRLWSDIDGDLCACRVRNAQQSGNQDRDGKKVPKVHVFLPRGEEKQLWCQTCTD
jgi:hypothetical protein